jgi:hypothetical protein
MTNDPKQTNEEVTPVERPTDLPRDDSRARRYVEASDKPSPLTVAQVEVPFVDEVDPPDRREPLGPYVNPPKEAA